jgi:hypothetical protein
MIVRAASVEESGELDQAPPLVRLGNGLGEIPTCSLNPVINFLTGAKNSSHDDDAFETLAMMGMTSAIHILRRMGGDSSSHAEMHFHRSADFLDDLLQPDEDVMRARQVRPPCFFTLGYRF